MTSIDRFILVKYALLCNHLIKLQTRALNVKNMTLIATILNHHNALIVNSSGSFYIQVNRIASIKFFIIKFVKALILLLLNLLLRKKANSLYLLM